jgi:transposase
MNTKLQAVCDSQGCPISFSVTAEKISNYLGAVALLSSVLSVEWLLGDRVFDADWFREILQDKTMRPCTPDRKSHSKAVRYGKLRYKRRNGPSRDIAAQCTAGQ